MSLPQSQLSFSSVSSAQAVNLLASQIPKFSGSESDNVRLWVQRIEKVAQIHSAPQGVIYLAASSKLTGSARIWFDYGSGDMLESWSAFKDALVRRFTRKILFHVAMQKIEARKWNYSKESFYNYAMDKLILMHLLQLSAEESMHLLINSIASRSLRGTAASIKADTIDPFLEEMDIITSATDVENDKK